jgi:hypothetical protein
MPLPEAKIYQEHEIKILEIPILVRKFRLKYQILAQKLSISFKNFKNSLEKM